MKMKFIVVDFRVEMRSRCPLVIIYNYKWTPTYKGWNATTKKLWFR